MSPLLTKKALDAMLDELAETALGGGSRVDLMDQRKKNPNRLPGEYAPPEEKGTEFQTNNPIVIPAKDLHAPDPANAEFFKESEPAPEFEMSASGVRRVYALGKYESPEWEQIQTFLTSKGYRWLGRVSDGTELWSKGTQRLIYNPKTKTWQHRDNNVVDSEGTLDDLAQKIAAKTSAFKACVACECGDCLKHKFANEPWCGGCDKLKKNCTCEGCQCPENKNKKAGDVVSYGMGQPLGGTDNPNAGNDDENADEDQNTGLGGIDMTSSLDSMPLTAALSKIAAIKSVAWWLKSARPTEEKIQLLMKQLNLTPEQIELAIAADPSPQQKDFVATIAKWFAKKLIALPEDTAKLKEQLGLFQKLKKSPKFKGNKDLQQYDPATLFKTIEENQQNISEKEKKRTLVRQGASVVVDEGNLTIYKVTDPTALIELSGGTNWCTAHRSHGTRYLKMGPTYVFFKDDSAFAQLHPASNQFMDRQDVCMVSDMEDSLGATIAKIVEDPTALRGLQLLSKKEPEVAAWVKENAADSGTVEQILGRKKEEEQAQGETNREMTVRHAIQVNQALPPEQEAHLVNQNVDVDLLFKYAEKFHAGQPWQPLEQAVYQEPNARSLVRYIDKFRDGQRWPAGEQKILSLVSSQGAQKNYNESGMDAAIAYASDIIQGRWPELETFFHRAPATPTNGKGSAEYAINILKQRWTNFVPATITKPDGETIPISGGINEEYIIQKNPRWYNEYSKKFMPEDLWDRFRKTLLDRTGLDEDGYRPDQDFWIVREWADIAEFVDGSGDHYAQEAMEYALDSEAETPNNTDIPDVDDMAEEIAKNLSYTAMKNVFKSLQGEEPDLVARWERSNSLQETDFTNKIQLESLLVYTGRYSPECSVWQNIRQAFEEGAQANYRSRRIGDLEYAINSDMYERGDDSEGRPIYTEMRYGPEFKTRFGGNWRVSPVYEVLDREGAYRMMNDDEPASKMDISGGQLSLYMMEPDTSDDENNEESYELMDRWYTKGAPRKNDPNQMQLQFQSSLLKKKKALVQMHETPTMLPPRNDIRRHIDEQEQNAIMGDVREGLHDAPSNTLKPGIKQIDPRINPLGVQSSKQADYDQEQDQADEYFLEQAQDMQNEAKRYFMEEDYIKQLCDDYFPPKTMEEMWEMMGPEWTAEFYGTPYQRVEDFTDASAPKGRPDSHPFTPSRDTSTKESSLHINCPACKTASLKPLSDEAKGYKSSMILAECQNCMGFYSLPSNK